MAVQCGMNLLSEGAHVTSDEARALLRNSVQLFSVVGTTLDPISFYKIALYFRIFNAICRPVA